jgi:hypothetical protein
MRLDEQGVVIPEDKKDVAGQVTYDISGVCKAELGNEPDAPPLTVLGPG